MATRTIKYQREDNEPTSKKEDDSRLSNGRGVSPLPSLPSCPVWLQLSRSQKRKVRKVQRIASTHVCDNVSFSRTMRLPILPHTTVVSEILPFCDESTLMAFRGVSREFRDLEIPREFHFRAMKKIALSNENNLRKQERQQQLLQNTSIPEGIRYSYKKKVLNEQERKVWIFLRDLAEESQIEEGTGSSQVLSHSDYWSMETVASKVLKLIQDIEFYNGSVYGYDQDRARNLLLEKGWIDDGDFAQPQELWTKILEKNISRKHHKNEYPVYGSWRAEASVRDISLTEALEILSDNRSMSHAVCKTKRRWRSPFQKRKDKRARAYKEYVQKTIRDNSVENKLGSSLLLAARGNNSDDFSSISSGIRLAEYSTTFDKTKMSCSILLVRTLGGAEAEVRVLSGKVEPPSGRSWKWFQSKPTGKGLTISRHSNSSINLTPRSN